MSHKQKLIQNHFIAAPAYKALLKERNTYIIFLLMLIIRKLITAVRLIDICSVMANKMRVPF